MRKCYHSQIYLIFLLNKGLFTKKIEGQTGCSLSSPSMPWSIITLCDLFNYPSSPSPPRSKMIIWVTHLPLPLPWSCDLWRAPEDSWKRIWNELRIVQWVWFAHLKVCKVAEDTCLLLVLVSLTWLHIFNNFQDLSFIVTARTTKIWF